MAQAMTRKNACLLTVSIPLTCIFFYFDVISTFEKCLAWKMGRFPNTRLKSAYLQFSSIYHPAPRIIAYCAYNAYGDITAQVQRSFMRRKKFMKKDRPKPERPGA